MAQTLNRGDALILKGFNALGLGVAARTLTVLSDANADNVAATFSAVVTAGMSIEAETVLQVDPRFAATAEVVASADLLLENSAVVRDANGTKWKVIRIERNAGSPINKYTLLQVEAGLDT